MPSCSWLESWIFDRMFPWTSRGFFFLYRTFFCESRFKVKTIVCVGHYFLNMELRLKPLSVEITWNLDLHVNHCLCRTVSYKDKCSLKTIPLQCPPTTPFHTSPHTTSSFVLSLHHNNTFNDLLWANTYFLQWMQIRRRIFVCLAWPGVSQVWCRLQEEEGKNGSRRRSNNSLVREQSQSIGGREGRGGRKKGRGG